MNHIYLFAASANALSDIGSVMNPNSPSIPSTVTVCTFPNAAFTADKSETLPLL